MKEQPATSGSSKTLFIVLAVVGLVISLFGILAVGAAVLVVMWSSSSGEIEPHPPVIAVQPADQVPIEETPIDEASQPNVQAATETDDASLSSTPRVTSPPHDRDMRTTAGSPKLDYRAGRETEPQPE